MTSGERVQRLVFGEAADEYDRFRPHYPDPVFDLLLASGGSSGTPDDGVDAVLDVGCGTGRSAAAFASRGIPGHAVEPDPLMAAVARANLPDSWTLEVSDFERCEAGGRHDWRLITCAQAWHWIDHESGLGHAHGLLAPGGVLALFWNRPEFDDDPLRRAMDEVYDTLAPDMRSSLRGRGTEPKGRMQGIDTDDPPPGWTGVSLDEVTWRASYTTAQWLGLLGTHSDHRLLEPTVREELHGAIGDLIDQAGGEFVLPYRVEIIRFTR